MKKKTLIITLAAAVIILAAAGGTLAWLTDTESVENTFTAGNVSITLTETKNIVDGQWAGKLIPGSTLEKDPTVTVAAGSEDSWVYVRVEMPKELDDVLKALSIDSTKWTVVAQDDAAEGFDQVYGYNTALQATEYATLFNTVEVIGAGIDNTELSAANEKIMKITAYAIQAENMTTLEDAWTAYNSN